MARNTWTGDLVIESPGAPMPMIVNVGICKAVDGEKPLFKNVVPDGDGGYTPIQRQDINPITGEVVDPDEVCKGFDTGSGLVILTKDEIAEANAVEQDKTIRIDAFVPETRFNNALLRGDNFFIQPGKVANSDVMLVALREMLRRSKTVAVGKMVSRGNLWLVAIRVNTENDLLVQRMIFASDFRNDDCAELRDRLSHVNVSKQQAEMLVEAFVNPLKADTMPETTNEVRARLDALIEAKAKGQHVSLPKHAPAAPVKSGLEALLGGLAQQTAAVEDQRAKSGVRR